MARHFQQKEDFAQGRETYTLQQFAKLLGIGLTNAYERAKCGDLPVQPFRVGARYLFPRRAVDELLGIENITTEESDG